MLFGGMVQLLSYQLAAPLPQTCKAQFTLLGLPFESFVWLVNFQKPSKGQESSIAQFLMGHGNF